MAMEIQVFITSLEVLTSCESRFLMKADFSEDLNKCSPSFKFEVGSSLVAVAQMYCFCTFMELMGLEASSDCC